MDFNRILILDGYTDEPAGLGVPPYIDVYPRYIAGAVWTVKPDAMVKYITVDQARMMGSEFFRLAESMDMVIVIAGMAVPGKYLGGTPIRLSELDEWFRLISKPLKILTGPAARFGIGIEGGRVAELPEKVATNFDVIVKGDPEVVIYDILRERSIERIDPYKLRNSYSEIEEFIIRGTRIVLQHPNYGKNLIVEIETFRGCPRVITGGCSFCIEPLYGIPKFRDQKSIVKEIEHLYRLGVKHFRLGRQPDIFAYKSIGVGEFEFPKPNPEEIRKLFYGIRCVAPNLKTLHIDNVNPGTVYHHPDESKKVAKIIIEYHTPGDVAAYGIESVDPKVIKLNNLKVMPDEAMEAIKILNEVGAKRGWNGLPELLPGINFVFGLIGETKETYHLAYEFLKEVYNRGYMVRRINIRQVLVFPHTRMWHVGTKYIEKHRGIFKVFKEKIRREIDVPMLRRVIPKGTILRNVFTELHENNHTYARQVGSYPILVDIPMKLPLHKFMDFVIVDHGPRSVTGIPYPLDINNAPLRILKLVPGLDSNTLMRIIKCRPIRDLNELVSIVGKDKAKYFTLKPQSR
ncbi:MAG TPA: radical SAM protein [Desulfurococcales archaeon]|nr:radical SAM protein [Desulfurococcales archaeon]